MTTSPQESGDQPTTHSADPVGAPAPVAYPAYPGTGYQPAPAPPGRGGTTGLVIAGVIGLAAGIGIGIGGMAIAANDDPEPSASNAPIDTASTTSTGGPDHQSRYSMSSVTNACDLIDPTLLHQWSATPEGAPVNRETRPSSLSCTAKFSTPSTVTTYQNNNAEIQFEAEFVEDGAAATYDSWKRHDTHTTGAGLSSGEVTGIGAKGYWHSEVDDTLSMQQYFVGVQDGNVVARVRIILWLADDEPAVSREDLDKVARSEVRMALDGLRT